jgi:hypothetical protein
MFLGLFAALALAAVPAVAAQLPGTSKPFAPKDCTKPEVKPSRIVLACADFGLFVRIKHWTAWNDDRAKGRGALHANECVPLAECGPGQFKKYKAKVRLSEVRTQRCGGSRVPMFTKMVLRFPRDEPDYANRIEKSRLFCTP